MQSYVSRRRGYQKVMNFWNSISSKPYDNTNLKPHAYDYLETRFAPTTTTTWFTEAPSRISTNVIYPGGVDNNNAIHSALDVVKSNSLYLTNLEPEATELVMEKIYGQLRGNSELLVDLAESRQTLQLLMKALQLKKRLLKVAAEIVLPNRTTRTQRLNDFYKSKRDLKSRRNPRKSAKQRARATADLASNQWLQYRYGVMPLIYSLYDAADNLRRTIYTGTFSIRKGAQRVADDDFYQVVNGPTPTQTSWSVTGITRVSMNLNFRAPDPSEQHALNWSSLNPATIVWELLPLSFVADWFVNVGDQLRAWENHTVFSRHFRGGTKSVYQREDRQGYYIEGPNGPQVEVWPNGEYKTQNAGYLTTCGATAVKVAFARTLVTSLPRPAGLRVKVNLNASRVADAASLVNSFLRRFR